MDLPSMNQAEVRSESARALSGGNLIDSPNLCPICQKVPLRGRQDVCSGKCRSVRSRQRRAAILRERDAKIGLLLRTALEAIEEALDVLEETP
jgi:predicted nucleic acid-binding Zn ribbon protein